MKRLVFYIILIFITVISCNSHKNIVGKFKSQNFGNTFYLILNEDNKGKISFTNEYRERIFDSIYWMYDNKKKTVILNRLKLDSFNVILFPKVLLYGGKNLLMRTDSAYYLFYKIKPRYVKEERDFYLYQLKKSGYETRFIYRHFGDSLLILNKINAFDRSEFSFAR